MTAPQPVARPTSAPPRWRSLALAGLALSLGVPCAAVAPAVAATEAAPTTAAEITIVAPEIVRRPAGKGRHGQQVEVASLTRKVSYADLDLTRPSDADELRNRVKKVSRDACQQLEARAPSKRGTPTASEQDCEQNARTEALAVANQLVSAANAP